MNPEAAAPRALREVEQEVEAEGRKAVGEPLGRLLEKVLLGWPGEGLELGRRKRVGQFWALAGPRHLDALEEARDNGHWDQLWLTA